MMLLYHYAINIGIGNFGKSTLLMLLNRNANKDIVAAEFVKWNKSGGKIIAGLTRRREAEKKLFLL